ncbi:hypothetical protein BHE18_16505 [Rossellomorea aquimaris]|uniref:DUF4367 domain-containing protein n=2 Tax=Rossellomorea aquimaris TaxID=189382 RepID=A0A1J6WDU6_9BACI|nr:hypothetical protein BHE18_16505 [Rossellomorea aquimaris]
MERNIKELVKESPLNKISLSNERKMEMFHQIKSGAKEKKAIKNRFIFAPLLSTVFVAACISIFGYYGSTELRLLENKNGNSNLELYEVDIKKPALLGENYKFPTKLPFIVEGVTTNTRDDYSYGEMISVRFEGEQDQVLRVLFFESDNEKKHQHSSGEKIESGDIIGYYHSGLLFKDNKLNRSSFHWSENEETEYDIYYDPGKSESMLDKNELMQIAESFQ